MKTSIKEQEKLLNENIDFNTLISENLNNWKNLLFLIITLEIIAALFEFIFIGSSHITKQNITHTFVNELAIAVGLTAFIWAFIYNSIYWNKSFFIYLFVLLMISLYLVVTNDFSFNFLLHNLNPSHILNLDFSLALIIELLFKVILTYLIFKLFISLKNSRK